MKPMKPVKPIELGWMSCLIALAGLATPALSGTQSGDRQPTEGRAAGVEEAKVLELGSKVPETLALRDFEGQATSFKDLRGKTVIVHFWSYRCPSEKHANPVFLAMEKRYADQKDVVLIGIVSNQNELGERPGEDADYSKHYKELREARKQVGYRHTILADHGNEVSDLFQARSTPHCFVIDKEGVLRYSGALDDDPRGDKGDQATNYVVNATEAVRAGRKPEVDSTKPYG